MALLANDPVKFARDVNGDLVVPFQLVAGLDAVALGIRDRLLLFAGEWFLDLDAGVPYLPSVDGSNAVTERAALLGQKFDPVKTRAAFRREILSVPGVVAVPVLLTSFDGPTRRLAITWRATTQFGDTPSATLTVFTNAAGDDLDWGQTIEFAAIARAEDYGGIDAAATAFEDRGEI